MKDKKYVVSEKVYNKLMHQFVTSDNLIATDKEKFLKEHPDLFWKTDITEEIEMLEEISKQPVEFLDRKEVEKITWQIVQYVLAEMECGRVKIEWRKKIDSYNIQICNLAILEPKLISRSNLSKPFDYKIKGDK